MNIFFGILSYFDCHVGALETGRVLRNIPEVRGAFVKPQWQGCGDELLLVARLCKEIKQCVYSRSPSLTCRPT